MLVLFSFNVDAVIAQGHPAGTAQEFTELVKQLGDDGAEAREKATDALIEIGQPATDEVRRATDSADAEVQYRAKMILRAIEFRGKANFSKDLLGWYPTIFRDLGKSENIHSIYDVFRKITEWDEKNKCPTHKLLEDDVIEILKFLAEKEYKGLDWQEKWMIVELCCGRQSWVFSGWKNGVQHSLRPNWRQQIPSAIKYFIPLLKDEDRDVRDSVADALGMMGANEHADMIIPLLKDSNADNRATAVYALGQMKAKRHADKIVPLLKDANDGVRFSTVYALGKMGAIEYAAELIPLLKDKVIDVRVGAINAISQMDAKELSKELIPLLKDKDGSVRYWTLSAIERIGAQEHAKDIIPLLKDTDTAIRRGAASALGKIGAKNCVKELVPLLDDRNDDVRGFAGLAIIELGGRDVLSKKNIENILRILIYGGDTLKRGKTALLSVGVSEEEILKATGGNR